MKLGIVGAGDIARALTLLAIKRGHQVMISNSRGPETLADVARQWGCSAGAPRQAVDFADLVLMAIPFHACRTLPVELFHSKIVMDACNHYPGRDGADTALDSMQDTSGQANARHFQGARMVKAFNAILQRDIVAHARPPEATDRRALPIAGDDAQAREAVARWIDDIGFDVVDAGAMSECWRFERGMPGYCIPLRRDPLSQALRSAERGRRAAEGSWRAPRALD